MEDLRAEVVVMIVVVARVEVLIRERGLDLRDWMAKPCYGTGVEV